MPRFLGFTLDESQEATALRQKSANGYAPQDQPMLEALGILQKRRGQLRMNSALKSNPNEIREFLGWALGDKKYPLPPLVRKILCIKRTLIKDGMSSVKTSPSLRLAEENLLVEIDRMLKEDGVKDPDVECKKVGGDAATNPKTIVDACPDACDTINTIKEGVDELISRKMGDVNADIDAEDLAAKLSPLIKVEATAANINADELAAKLSELIKVEATANINADELATTLASKLIASNFASTISQSIVIPESFVNTLVQKIKTEGGYATSANIQNLSTTLSTTLLTEIKKAFNEATVNLDGIQAIQSTLRAIQEKLNVTATTATTATGTSQVDAAKIAGIQTSVADLLRNYTNLSSAFDEIKTTIGTLTNTNVQPILDSLKTFSDATAASLLDMTNRVNELPTSLNALKTELLDAINNGIGPSTLNLSGVIGKLDAISGLLTTHGQVQQAETTDIAEIKNLVTAQSGTLNTIVGLLKNAKGEGIFTAIDAILTEVKAVKTATEGSVAEVRRLLNNIPAADETDSHKNIIALLEQHRTETEGYLTKLDGIEAAIQACAKTESIENVRTEISGIAEKFDSTKTAYDNHIEQIKDELSNLIKHVDSHFLEVYNSLEFLIEASGRRNEQLEDISKTVKQLIEETPNEHGIVDAVTNAVNTLFDTKIVGKLDTIMTNQTSQLEILKTLRGDIINALREIGALKESIAKVLENLSLDDENSPLYRLYVSFASFVEELKERIAAVAAQCTDGDGGKDCSGMIEVVRSELAGLKSALNNLESQHTGMRDEVSNMKNGVDTEFQSQKLLISELRDVLDRIGSTIGKSSAVDTSEFTRQVQQLRGDITAAQARCCEDVLSRFKAEMNTKFDAKFEELKKLFKTLPPTPVIPPATPVYEFDTIERNRAIVPEPIPERPPSAATARSRPSTASSPTRCNNEEVLRAHPLECIEKAVLKREKDPVKMNANIRAIKQFIASIPTLGASRLAKELGVSGKIKYTLHEFLRGEVEELSRQVANMADDRARQTVTNYFMQKAVERGDLKYVGGGALGTRFTRKQKKNMSLKRRRRLPTE